MSMTRAWLVLAVSIVVVASCTMREKKEEKAPVTYTMTSFRLESAGGCATDSTACASYEIEYPVFTGLDSIVNTIISRRILQTADMGNPEQRGKTMEEVAHDFIQDFEKFTKEFPDPSGGWYYGANVSVVLLNDSLLTLATQDEYFTGGAHGGGGKYFINVDPRNGRDLTLEDFFKPGYEAALTAVGEQAFRKAREMADTTSLQQQAFEFPDNKFQLNKNYGFTPDGVTFYYNSYEVASYAAGPTEIQIPYTALTAWRK